MITFGRRPTGSLLLLLPAALGAAMAASSPVTVARPAAGGFESDAVWRSIFARPPAPAASDAVGAKRVALGRDLFADARLSGSGRASCASCHKPELAFTDGRPTALGPGGQPLARNTPTLLDAAWGARFYWDGRAPSLEAQMREPIERADELATTFPAIAVRLAADASLRGRFAAAFPGREAIDEAGIVAALAAYERSLASPETRFDRWVAGDDAALTAEERHGLALFTGKAGCVACHGGWRFTDGELHDIGLAESSPASGTAQAASRTAFKTPTLRELSRTAPYMHDGSLATLDAVLDHYSGRISLRPTLAPQLRKTLSLTDVEKTALISFLRTLSSAPNLPRRDWDNTPHD